MREKQNEYTWLNKERKEKKKKKKTVFFIIIIISVFSGMDKRNVIQHVNNCALSVDRRFIVIQRLIKLICCSVTIWNSDTRNT